MIHRVPRSLLYELLMSHTNRQTISLHSLTHDSPRQGNFGFWTTAGLRWRNLGEGCFSKLVHQSQINQTSLGAKRSVHFRKKAILHYCIILPLHNKSLCEFVASTQTHHHQTPTSLPLTHRSPQKKRKREELLGSIQHLLAAALHQLAIRLDDLRHAVPPCVELSGR